MCHLPPESAGVAAAAAGSAAVSPATPLPPAAMAAAISRIRLSLSEKRCERERGRKSEEETRGKTNVRGKWPVCEVVGGVLTASTHV